MLPSSGCPGTWFLQPECPSIKGHMRIPGSGDLDHLCLSGRTTRGPLGPMSDLGIEALVVELLLIVGL